MQKESRLIASGDFCVGESRRALNALHGLPEGNRRLRCLTPCRPSQAGKSVSQHERWTSRDRGEEGSAQTGNAAAKDTKEAKLDQSKLREQVDTRVTARMSRTRSRVAVGSCMGLVYAKS